MTAVAMNSPGMQASPSRHPVARAMRVILLATWGSAGALALFNYFA